MPGALRPLAVLALCPAVLAAGGCGPAGERAGTTIGDSAGIQLVRNRAGAAEPASATRIVRIGVVDGPREYLFDRITAIAVDRADTLYVAEQGTMSVRVFDPAGRYVRSFGRRGRGPGEFERIGRVWLIGDTVAVSGIRGEEVTTLFTPSGGVIAVLPDMLPGFRTIVRLARLPGGWLTHVGRDLAGAPTSSGAILLDTLILRIRDESNDTVGPPLHRIVRRRYSPARSTTSLGEREAHRRDLDVTRAAEIVAALPGPTIAARGGITRGFEPAAPAALDHRGWLHLTGQGYVIDSFDPTGRLVRRISMPHDTVPIAGADIDALRRAAERRWARAALTPDERRSRLLAIDAEIAARDVMHFPAVSGMLVGRDGSLWARRADVTTELPRARLTDADPTRPNALAPSRWDRFDAAGRFIGAVLLPAGFVATSLDRGVVTGVLRDQLGVEFVERYRVVEPPAP